MVIKSDGYDEMWDTLQWIAIMQLPVTAIFALHPAQAISHALGLLISYKLSF